MLEIVLAALLGALSGKVLRQLGVFLWVFLGAFASPAAAVFDAMAVMAIASIIGAGAAAYSATRPVPKPPKVPKVPKQPKELDFIAGAPSTRRRAVGIGGTILTGALGVPGTPGKALLGQ